MNWNEELEQKYIEFFETYEGDSDEDYNGYYTKGQVLRGIECGEGWKKHIEQFLKTLVWIKEHCDYIDNPNYDSNKPLTKENPYKIKGPKPEIKIFQIKEKFGECRCYVTGTKETEYNLERAVAKLEALCSITCERCGKLEYDCFKTGKNGWVYCLCTDCFERRYIH